MPLCKVCGMPTFWGVYGYGRYSITCRDCTKKIRLENKFISVWCKDHVYPQTVEKARHDMCNQDQIDYMWCHCSCHGFQSDLIPDKPVVLGRDADEITYTYERKEE